MGNTNEIKKKNRPKRGYIRHNAEIKEKALKMYAKGYTTKEIAVLLSCKECTLKFWAKKYHWGQIRKDYGGLSARIEKMRANGIRQKEIASILGVNRSTIYRIERKK